MFAVALRPIHRLVGAIVEIGVAFLSANQRNAYAHPELVAKRSCGLVDVRQKPTAQKFDALIGKGASYAGGELVAAETAHDVDVAKRLAKDLGVELQLVPTKWAGIIPALMAGKFDVIIGSMSVTPERNLKANFTVPYDYATIEVMANKEKTKGMKFPEDFNKPEVVVALRTGSTPVPVAKKVLPNATFRLFDDEAPAVQDVLSGRADVMFSSAPLPAFEVLRNPGKLYQPSTDAFYRQPVGMAIRKGDPDSLNVLDNWIRTVEAEGWLSERRHFWFKTTDWEAQVQ